MSQVLYEREASYVEFPLQVVTKKEVISKRKMI